MKVINEDKERVHMSILLIVLALLGGIVGGLYLTQITVGVGLIGGACLLAILARIAQARNQHLELMDKIDSQERNTHQG